MQKQLFILFFLSSTFLSGSNEAEMSPDCKNIMIALQQAIQAHEKGKSCITHAFLTSQNFSEPACRKAIREKDNKLKKPFTLAFDNEANKATIMLVCLQK